MLAMFGLLTSCAQNDSLSPEGVEKNMRLNFSIKTSSTEDALVTGGDGSFSSLALYIFNKADGTCEYAELIPEFTPAVQTLSRSVNVSSQTKVIYAIANYNVSGRTFSTPVTSGLTMEQLDELTVSDTGFRDTEIMMVGKVQVDMNSSLVVAEVPMERLAARLDIYMFKNQELLNDGVELVSIEFCNQVLNTNCRYKNEVMIQPAIRRNVQGLIMNDRVLNPMPADLSGIVPANVHTSFYTYQNLVASDKTDSLVTSYLRIKAKINGTPYTYKGYITDNGHVERKYSVMRNTVYSVMAMLDHPDNELVLKTMVYPWAVSRSEIGNEVSETDYQFTANGGGNLASYGSYASYQFRLTAPAGAVWIATLTNGLNFAFGTEGSVSGETAVSKGIAGPETSEIRVKATKPWSGIVRSTYLYITVNGEKLKINPLQSDGTRQFPGDNDTDVLIRQTGY